MIVRVSPVLILSWLWLCLVGPSTTSAFSILPHQSTSLRRIPHFSSPSETAEETVDYEIPDDAVVIIKPKAMKRLRELKDQQKAEVLVLRMGVRNGGCSGLSYVMDFSSEESIEEDDAVDEYPTENVKCVIDAKSVSPPIVQQISQYLHCGYHFVSNVFLFMIALDALLVWLRT